VEGESYRKVRLLRWNLYLTQLLVFVVALALLQLQGRLTAGLWIPAGWKIWGAGVASGLAVVAFDRILQRLVSEKRLDDGGFNRLLFQNLSYVEIAGITAWVALGEEMLFRGALQHWLGIIGTSLLFTLLHFRYLKQWILVGAVFGISCLFGGLTEWTGSLIPAVVAHFTVDFILGLSIRVARDS
jgi:uncharacterized protein